MYVFLDSAHLSLLFSGQWDLSAWFCRRAAGRARGVLVAGPPTVRLVVNSNSLDDPLTALCLRSYCAGRRYPLCNCSRAKQIEARNTLLDCA
jgi:hypothetical protein